MLQLELIFPNCLWFNTTHIFLYALSKTNGILADCSMHFHDGIERETIATRLHCIYFDHHIYVRKKKHMYKHQVHRIPSLICCKCRCEFGSWLLQLRSGLNEVEDVKKAKKSCSACFKWQQLCVKCNPSGLIKNQIHIHTHTMCVFLISFSISLFESPFSSLDYFDALPGDAASNSMFAVSMLRLFNSA